MTVRVSIADTRDDRSLSARFRRQRDKLLWAFMLERRAGVTGTFRVLDLGGTADYWRRIGFDLLDAHDIDVTCVNHIGTEFGTSATEAQRFRCIVGDACAMTDHADNSFDFVHSNSVIEHVGHWPEMQRFAREVRRLAPAHYVQTPYFWFPIDPHFYRIPMFHWLPESLRVKLLQRFSVGWSPAVSNINDAMRIMLDVVLLDRAQFGALFPDSQIVPERLALLTKSLIAIYGREPASH